MDDIDKFIESYQKAKADKKAEDEAAAEKAKRDAKNKADAGKKFTFDWSDEDKINKKLKNIDSEYSSSPQGTVLGVLSGDDDFEDLEDLTNEDKAFLKQLKELKPKIGRGFDWKEEDDEEEYIDKQRNKGYKVYQVDIGDYSQTLLLKPKKTAKK